MPAPTVADLLVAQPVEELEAMADGLSGQIAELEIQLRLVRDALERKRPRRVVTGTRSLSGVKREDVYRVVRDAGVPMSPPEVRAALALAHYDISTNAVRNHLVRLVDDDKALGRTEDGRYVLSNAQISFYRNGHRDPVASGLNGDQAQEPQQPADGS